jgi:outer membrane immunogenic protein
MGTTMQRESILGMTMAVLLAAPAMAADMPVKAPVAAAPVSVAHYSWTGFYSGAHGGYAWGRKEWVDVTNVPAVPIGAHNVSGWLAGGQLGYNWQSGNLVLGIEAQASWTDADGSHVFGPVSYSTEIKWLGTIAGRIGYAWERALIYAKGGAAFVDEDYTGRTTVTFVFNNATIPAGAAILRADETRWGWMAGGGLEIALAGNWSGKAEYNYMHLGKRSIAFSSVPPFVSTESFRIDQHLHVVKFGINYRFGGPVVARY